MGLLSSNSTAIDAQNTRSYSLFFGLLPTLATVAVLAIAAGLAAGLPAGASEPQNPLLAKLLRSGASSPQVALVLVDSPEDYWLAAELDPARTGVASGLPPTVVIVDTSAGAFTAETARELTRLEHPFEVVDLRGR